MHLEILRHDGPARLGRLHHEGVKVETPSVLWTPRAGKGREGFLEISPEKERNRNHIRRYGTIFAEEKIRDFGILPSFPAGYGTPREIVDEAVEKTVGFAQRYPGFGAVIEGGRYVELRTRTLEKLGDRPILMISNGLGLIKNHRKLVEVVTTARELANPNTALYMSDIPPNLFPGLAYMGVDLFDLKRAIIGAHEGRYLTPRGATLTTELYELPCPCPVCASLQPGELKPQDLRAHNINVTLAAIREVRDAIRQGELRNLVEERAASDLNAMGALRILDREKKEFLLRYTPLFSRAPQQNMRGSPT